MWTIPEQERQWETRGRDHKKFMYMSRCPMAFMHIDVGFQMARATAQQCTVCVCVCVCVCVTLVKHGNNNR